jgi:hypothetical protein
VVDRRHFGMVTGAALIEAVCGTLTPLAGSPLPDSMPRDPLIMQIEQSVPLLQRLDDTYGGGAHLGYVVAQVQGVAQLIRDGRRSERDARRLFVALADLAQLGGWMALDAAQPGLAQRYLLLGLRAAQAAEYPAMVAHVLADLSFQRASQGSRTDAVALGVAAAEAAKGSTGSVRASVLSRLALAYAQTGQTTAFEQTRGAALDAMEQRSEAEDPAWMYYLTPNHLVCQSGYALVAMGRRSMADGSRARGRILLRRGEHALRSGAHDHPLEHPGQRRALFEGAWLALGYVAHGKIEEACATAQVALSRTEQVRSPRSILLLEQLAHDFRRLQRNPCVREVLPQLDATVVRARSVRRSGFAPW